MDGTTIGWVRRCVVAAAIWGLSSCGGGGGSTVPQSSPADLIPAAAAPGEVLYADARVLRPLAANTRRSYRGVERPTPASLPIPYMNTVSQAATAGGVLLETASNGFNQGSDSMPVEAVGGNVLSRQVVDLGGGGAPVSVDLLELRSPVRDTDQYTVLQQRLEGATPDLDLDGRREAVDLAAFRRVVGSEPVVLFDGASFTAVRVDYVTRARVQLSKDNRLGPVVEILLSSWYVPEMGIVKQRYQASTAGEAGASYEETLVVWDGVTDGYGLTGVAPVRLPADDSAAPGATVGPIVSAARFGDGVVALTNGPAGTGTGSGALVRLDARGQALRSRVFAGWQPGTYRAMLAPVGDGVVVVQQSTVAPGYTLATFDAALQTATGPLGVPLDLGPLAPETVAFVRAVAGGADRFWVLYQRVAPGAPGNRLDLVLRAYDVNGRPVGAENVLDGASPTSGYPSAKLAARDGRVVASWTVIEALGHQRHAVIGPADTAARVGELTGDAAFSEPDLQLLVAGGEVSVFWSGFLEASAVDRGPDVRLRAVTIAPDASIVRSQPGPIDQEMIGTSWPRGSSESRFMVDGDDRHVVVFGGAFDFIWPEDRFETAMAQFVIFDQGPTPLDARSARAWVRRVRPEPGTLLTWRPEHLFVFGDRVLLLGIDNVGLATGTFWLR